MANYELKRRLFLMGLFLVVVFGALFGWNLFKKIQMGKSMANYAQPPVVVNAVTVSARQIPRALDAIGSLEAVHQVTLSPEIDGRITQLYIQPGATVKAGQPLLQLNDGPEQGDLQRLRAQAKLAKINLERSTQLLNLAVSRSEVDAQQATLDEVDGEIARTQALIAQKLIRAPFSGQLGVQRVHVGQFVKTGNELVTLTDLSTLYLNLTLPEQTHAQLKPGLPVKFSVDALPGREFEAKLLAVEPQIGTDSRAIKLQAQLKNPTRELAPGMFVRAAVQLTAEENVVSIPTIAIDYSIHGDSVYIIRKQKTDQGEHLVASRALVRTDGQSGDNVIVRSGVKPGEIVVTAGQMKLHDGATVQIEKSGTLDKIPQKVQSRPE
jgi:multidrug efflux system membrane fusion protein